MAAKLITEFIGTFFLVLTIGLSVLIQAPLAALAIASVLMVMVYMGGHVSGAHYNPAVTLAVWMRGKLPASEIAPYMGAQILAAIVAAFCAYIITGDVLTVAPAEETSLAAFFLLELLFTFALVIVILNVATSVDTAGNSYFGLAIGFTVFAGAVAAGPISGGAFNPAVAIGPILVDLISGEGTTISGLWVYLVSTFAGAALAAIVFKMQSPADAEAAA
ncbi:MAG: aquaporin [Bacteroidota bacterium]